MGCNLGKAAAISPKASPRSDCVLRDCHVASLLAMTRQGSARCTSALLPLNIPYKAVTDRRYTPYFGVCRFHGRLYGSGVRSREGHAAPLQCTAGGLCIFHSSFFSLQDSFPCAPPLQHTNGNFPLPSRSVPTHNVINIFVLWKKHKNPRGNPKRSLIIPSRRDLTNAGKCDKIKAQRESGAFKNTDPVFGIARQDRFVADRLGTPAFAAGAPFFFRRGREENQNV